MAFVKVKSSRHSQLALRLQRLAKLRGSYYYVRSYSPCAPYLVSPLDLKPDSPRLQSAVASEVAKEYLRTRQSSKAGLLRIVRSSRAACQPPTSQGIK